MKFIVEKLQGGEVVSYPKPYTLPEAERLAAYHGAPATRCPLDDDRFLATVCALDAANAREAAIWAALSRAGVSHGQSVEGLEQGLSVLATLNARVAELEAALERMTRLAKLEGR
jgi:hypothetical protein